MQVRELLLQSADRRYFLIERSSDGKPLGRFYYRRWQLHGGQRKADWELNIFIADPADRGKGYGTAAQTLAVAFLLGLPETQSVFAYTDERNLPERKALTKAGLTEVGLLPSPYYGIVVPTGKKWILYARER